MDRRFYPGRDQFLEHIEYQMEADMKLGKSGQAHHICLHVFEFSHRNLLRNLFLHLQVIYFLIFHLTYLPFPLKIYNLCRDQNKVS